VTLSESTTSNENVVVPVKQTGKWLSVLSAGTATLPWIVLTKQLLHAFCTFSLWTHSDKCWAAMTQTLAETTP
jgi:hypothetical protein